MTQSKEERVHHVFQSIHGKYDKMNSIISFQRHASWLKDTMKRMDVQKDAKALDVCCGTADWAISLSEAVGPDGEVTGLDFSENMLSVGKEKVEERELNNVNLVHGNAMELPYEDNTFDYVTVGFGLRNVPDYLQVLSEMRRVVKPDGLVVCLETSKPTAFGFKQIYWLYFKYIMPFFGKIFAKNYDAYSWLHESAKDFPGKEELKDLFKDAGLDEVTYKSYFAGVAAAHFGRKTE